MERRRAYRTAYAEVVRVGRELAGIREREGACERDLDILVQPRVTAREHHPQLVVLDFFFEGRRSGGLILALLQQVNEFRRKVAELLIASENVNGAIAGDTHQAVKSDSIVGIAGDPHHERNAAP